MTSFSCSSPLSLDADTEKDEIEDIPAISPPIPPRPAFLSSVSAYSLPHLPTRKLHKSCSSNSSSSSASIWSSEGDENTSSCKLVCTEHTQHDEKLYCHSFLILKHTVGNVLLESQSLEELEKAAAEAERLALELRKKARSLKGSM